MRLNSILNFQDVPPFAHAMSSVESSPRPRTPHVRSPRRSVHSPTQEGLARKPRANGSSVSSFNGFIVEPVSWTSPRYPDSVNSPPGQARDRLARKSYVDYKDLHSSESSFPADCRSRNSPPSTHRLDRVTNQDCNNLNPSADFVDSVELPSPPLSDRTPTFLLNRAPLCSSSPPRHPRCPSSLQQRRSRFPVRLNYASIRYDDSTRSVSKMAGETPCKLPGIHEIRKLILPCLVHEMKEDAMSSPGGLT